MIDTLKWFGWMIATGLLAALLLQRSCMNSPNSAAFTIHDTIRIPGDSQLYLEQDTILKPYKIYFKDSVPKIDTEDVIKNYFASRVYYDTIKARNVTAVIKDSMSGNKIASRKVLIENTRDLHVTMLQTKPVNKVFIGGFLGYSFGNALPVAGISISLVTRKDALYFYEYDAIGRTNTIGASWKIHFTKNQ